MGSFLDNPLNFLQIGHQNLDYLVAVTDGRYAALAAVLVWFLIERLARLADDPIVKVFIAAVVLTVLYVGGVIYAAAVFDPGSADIDTTIYTDHPNRGFLEQEYGPEN